MLSRLLAFAVCALMVGLPQLQAADLSEKEQQTVDEMVNRAIQYLRTTGQAEDGSFSKEASPAITSLVTAALIKSGRPLEDPMVAKALKFIEWFVREDCGIHQD